MAATGRQDIAPDHAGPRRPDGTEPESAGRGADSSRRRRRRRSRRPRKDGNDMAILVVICVVTLLALAAFLSYKVYGATPAPWQSIISELRSRSAAFTVGRVTLGMTPAQVRRVHADVSTAIGKDGSEVAAFQHEGGRYTVSFLRPSEGHKAYRIRYHQAFEGSEEGAIHESLMRSFGMPSASHCDRGGIAADKACRLRWWAGDGVAVEAGTRVIKSFPVRSRTELTVTATDTRLEGRQRRVRLARPRYTGPAAHLPAPDILPF